MSTGLTFDMDWYRRCTPEHRDRIRVWAQATEMIPDFPFTVAVTLTDESGRRGHLEVIDFEATKAARDAGSGDTFVTRLIYNQTFSAPFPIT